MTDANLTGAWDECPACGELLCFCGACHGCEDIDAPPTADA